MFDRPIHDLYWLWLSLRCPPGHRSGHLLLEQFHFDPKAVYEADEEAYRSIDGLSPELIEKLCDKSSVKEREIYYWCQRNNVSLLTMSSPNYPKRLLDLPDAPLLLYFRGKLPDVDHEVLIATVGTRRMSSYGKRHAYTICHDIIRCGGIVVSGMARGIDSVCHRGALDAGGPTIAVLGCGIDRAYPPENRELMEEIAANGTVITEFPPFTPPEGRNFPIRNRIISGLCVGTVVMEADARSGAMITAKKAREQGRNLFALPGAVGEAGSSGPISLIQDGAKAVRNGRDIMEEYEFDYPDRVFIERTALFRLPFISRKGHRRGAHPVQPQEEIPPMEELREEPLSFAQEPEEAAPAEEAPTAPASRKRKHREQPTVAEPVPPPPPAPKEQEPPVLTDPLQQVLYTLLCDKKEASVDEMVAATGATVPRILTAATFLEIQGVIQALPGGHYSLTEA